MRNRMFIVAAVASLLLGVATGRIQTWLRPPQEPVQPNKHVQLRVGERYPAEPLPSRPRVSASQRSQERSGVGDEQRLPPQDMAIYAAEEPPVVPHPTPDGWDAAQAAARLWATTEELVDADLVHVDCLEYPCLVTLRTHEAGASPESDIAMLQCSFLALSPGNSSDLVVAYCGEDDLEAAFYTRLESRMLDAMEAGVEE